MGHDNFGEMPLTDFRKRLYDYLHVLLLMFGNSDILKPEVVICCHVTLGQVKDLSRIAATVTRNSYAIMGEGNFDT